MNPSLLPDGFHRFGNIFDFAIDVRLLKDPDDDLRVPVTSAGSWGAWRIWIAGINLCRQTLRAQDQVIEVDEVRWYLAPFIRWILKNWGPILHESRLPSPSVRSLSSRLAYLSMLHRFGDEDRFACWQEWGHRHSLRSCAEGGVLPDLFFLRVGDDIEVSWGDRFGPGDNQALCVAEAGLARASVESIAVALNTTAEWFLQQPALEPRPWLADLRTAAMLREEMSPENLVSWFLDASPEPGPLFTLLKQADTAIGDWFASQTGKLFLARLAPQVAMFGALSPDIGTETAVKLIGSLMTAETDALENSAMLDLVEDVPAWASESPWDDGYQLAREVLEETDPDPAASYTDIYRIVNELGIQVSDLALGENGPRGVAIAGKGYRPTILVNIDSISNALPGGRRFTLAHELCHILFDRDKAKSIIHASTPWASPAVEQRANAFAAMVLMPPSRIALNTPTSTREDLLSAVTTLAEALEVSKTALVSHLANMGQMDELAHVALLTDLQK